MTRPQVFPSAVATLLLLLIASLASGCPLCDSDTAQQVRAGLLDQSTVPNVLAMVLPFAVLLGIVAVVHFGWPRLGQGTHEAQRPGAGRTNDR